jgi:hypothetical protein
MKASAIPAARAPEPARLSDTPICALAMDLPASSAPNAAAHAAQGRRGTA